MSKYMFVAAVLVVTACGEKKPETPAAEPPAAATPAPAPSDSTMMKHDSMAPDTTKK